MPTKHAAIKDLRKSRRRTARNERLKTHVKSLLRKTREIIKNGSPADAKTAVISLQQIIDKAAKQRVISRNAANRKKASVMSALARTK